MGYKILYIYIYIYEHCKYFVKLKILLVIEIILKYYLLDVQQEKNVKHFVLIFRML